MRLFKQLREMGRNLTSDNWYDDLYKPYARSIQEVLDQELTDWRDVLPSEIEYYREDDLRSLERFCTYTRPIIRAYPLYLMEACHDRALDSQTISKGWHDALAEAINTKSSHLLDLMGHLDAYACLDAKNHDTTINNSVLQHLGEILPPNIFVYAAYKIRFSEPYFLNLLSDVEKAGAVTQKAAESIVFDASRVKRLLEDNSELLPRNTSFTDVLNFAFKGNESVANIVVEYLNTQLDRKE